jgi:Holliday junction DNA helicase RuvA
MFVYTAVREDGIFLYGLNTKEEKKLFLDLITVNGLGPKMGITVLSQMSVNELISAISTSDVKKLCTVKGLGKKTAELIVVSMRDQVSQDLNSVMSPLERVADKDQSEAVFALVSLGMSNTEAVKLVAEIAKTTTGLENIIREALKRLP